MTNRLTSAAHTLGEWLGLCLDSRTRRILALPATTGEDLDRAAAQAVALTRDGLDVPTAGDIDAMIADLESTTRHGDRGTGGVT